MTSYCRSGIALQSISHDCPMQGRHWQCCEVIICTCWFQITNLHSFQKQLCSRSPIYWELELRREIVIQLCWKLKNFSLPIAIDICRFTASPKFHCCLLLHHILHEFQCLVARNFSLFKLITFYWRFFPFPLLLFCVAFSWEGCCTSFAGGPRNPLHLILIPNLFTGAGPPFKSPLNIYASPFSSWMFEQTFHFCLLKISWRYLETTSTLFMHGVVRRGPWVQFHPRIICILQSKLILVC